MISDTAANLDDTSKRNLQTSSIWDNLPESKLELIDGRLIVGNSFAGSRYLLWAILQTLGPRAALPLAPRQMWWSALATTFQAPPMLSSTQAWERWAAQVGHTPQVAPAGPHFAWDHHEAYRQLMLGLHLATREGDRIGRSIQRFVMRLGEDALLPDLQCFRRDRLHHLQTYYFDGPADLAIEVTLPGAETQDREVKRRLYAAGGVPEYWIVDPASRTFEFLRLTADRSEAQPLDAEGRYRSTSMPGLICDPGRLWFCLDHPEQRHGLDAAIFVVEPEHVNIGPPTNPNDDEIWEWEWRQLALPIGPRPTAITFDQYITWCPEAKFELLDGKPHIGGWEGTRNVLGLLLMSFGLEDAVALHHPREWVAALLAEQQDELSDAGRRDAWWSVARQAAALLRERFGVQRVAVIGDLVRPEPLGFWSELTLVAWGLPKDYYTIYHALDELVCEPRIEIRSAEDASPRQRAAFEAVAMDIGGASMRTTLAKPHPAQATPKETVAVIRALEQILADLRQGKSYQITRLTRLKRLCAESDAATQFAAFVAQRSLQRLVERKRPDTVAPERWERYISLATEAVDRMRQYLVEDTPEARAALGEQMRALEQAQSTYKNIPYGAVRIVECWEAMLIETALRCMLTPHDSARLGYELARDYVERYDPHYGTGLISESAEPLEEVIGFWRAYMAERQAQHEKGEL